jgi:hypothetical protein
MFILLHSPREHWLTLDTDPCISTPIHNRRVVVLQILPGLPGPITTRLGRNTEAERRYRRARALAMGPDADAQRRRERHLNRKRQRLETLLLMISRDASANVTPVRRP